jgi:hypothetical protein
MEGVVMQCRTILLGLLPLLILCSARPAQAEQPVVVDGWQAPYESLPPAAAPPPPQFNDLMLQSVPLYSFADTAMGVRLYSDQTTRVYSLPPSQLPPAADPNDFHVNPLHAPPALSVAAQSRLLHFLTTPTGAAFDENGPRLSYGLQMRPGVFYDTGAFEDGSTDFRPGTIALDGTADARRRGRIHFHELEHNLQALPARLQLNAAFDQVSGIDFAQAYVDGMHASDNTLRGRSVFVRAYAGDHGLLVGKAETAFGDLGSSPMLIANGALPIGAVGIIDESTNAFTGVAQLRYMRHWDDDRVETTFSLEENRTIGDVDFDGQVEHYWPTFVARLRLLDDGDFNSLQIAGLARPIGFNDATFEDRTTTGWGLSVIGKICDEARLNALYGGVVGGQGIGGYMYGDVLAARAITPTDIQSFNNYGAYAAYQHVWGIPSIEANLSSNVAYGFVSASATAPTDNVNLQQAWCNLLWNASDNAAFGIEYQYAFREVVSGVDGDNHRIMFIAQFSTPTARRLGFEETSYRSADMPKPIQYRRL